MSNRVFFAIWSETIPVPRASRLPPLRSGSIRLDRVVNSRYGHVTPEAPRRTTFIAVSSHALEAKHTNRFYLELGIIYVGVLW